METILMSGRERKRLVVLAQVRSGKLRLRVAAELLEVSTGRTFRGDLLVERLRQWN